MPSMQSTVIIATTLLGSLLQHANAAAAPGAVISGRADAKFPDCIATCMRNSGCFDTKCVCKGAADGVLSDIVICMNQWCPSGVTATDLITPLESQCTLPKAAVQDAEKKGGVVASTDNSDSSSSSSNSKPSAGKGKDADNEVTATYDLGAPVTNAAPPATTATAVHPVGSGTLTVPTDAATTGLLTDDNATGSFGAATSSALATAKPTSSSSSAAASASGTGSNSDEGNAAGLAGQASMFGAVAAMGFALAMGF